MIQGEDRLVTTLDDLINRVAMTKNMVQELLMRVDRSEISKWSDLVDSFSSIAAEMGQLSQLARDCGIGDQTMQLRRLAVTPSLLTLEHDPKLATMTEGRIHTWNHAVPPDYLRTKPERYVSQNEQTLHESAHTLMQKTPEQIQKQSNALNTRLDQFIVQLRDLTSLAEPKASTQPSGTSKPEETAHMVRMLYKPQSVQESRQMTLPYSQ